MDTVAINYYTVVAICNVYMAFTLAILLATRHTEFLQKRQPVALLCHGVVATALMNDYLRLETFASVHGVTHTTRDVLNYAIQYLCAPAWTLFYFLRCISLVGQYYGNVMHIKESEVTKMNFVERITLQALRYFADAYKPKDTSSFSTEADILFKSGIDTTGIITITPRTILKIGGLTLCLGAAMLAGVLGYAGCYSSPVYGQCFNEDIRKAGLDFLPIYILVIISFFVIPYFIFLIRKVKDSFYLRLEFQVTLAVFMVFFLLFALNEYRYSLFVNINPNGSRLWLLILVLLCHTASVTIPIIVALIRERKKKIVLLDHSLEAFNKILNDRRLFVEFKKSLAEDFCIENGLFWDDLMALLQASADPSSPKKPADINKAVLGIYSNYIKAGSRYELNISAGTKKKITQAITAKKYDLTILESAKNEVFQMMYLNSFPRFIIKLKNSGQASSANTRNTETSNAV
ncbi:hypothetical protein BKA69DRAFT_1122015 [Paraphysoderma sedebokerense]|nr:hypothetical protein BKA69DRAFT_1122015 [Paraphysoderma sedebokerense]